MPYKTILFSRHQGIGVLTFNRPEVRNAINALMIEELNACLDEIEDDSDLRVLILTGTGDCFMSGGDVEMIHAGLKAPYQFFLLHDRLTGFGLRLTRLSIPVIAAISGPAVGGGLEIALACDFRIAADTALLGLPEAGLGIMPGAGGTARLARIVGREMALYMEMTGELIDAREARRIGLISTVVSQEDVMTAAEDLAARIMKNAPASVAAIKRAVTRSADMPMDDAVDYCQYAALFLSTTEDSREGLEAFLEKRQPDWAGK